MEACCSSSATAWASGSVPDRRQLTIRRVIPVKCSPFLMCSTAAHRGLIALAHPLLRSGSLVPVAWRQRRARSRSRPVKAVFDRFTERAIKAVVFAQREAKGLGKDMVFTQHLLLGLVEEERSPVGFLGSGITIEVARKAFRTIWKDFTYMESGLGLAIGVPFSMSCKSVLESSVGASKKMGCNFIAPKHIALGHFAADDGSTVQVLQRYCTIMYSHYIYIYCKTKWFLQYVSICNLGANLNQLASVAIARIHGELAKDGREPLSALSFNFHDKSTPKNAVVVKFSDKKNDKSALSQFCVDLNAQASEGRIDPVIGRATEIERMVQILCRGTKNNPILLGDPGVGKTAIAEGLALRIANSDVPVFLMSKRICHLMLVY